MTRVAIIGSRGQLGQDLLRAWQQARPRDTLIGLEHAQIEVEGANSVHAALTGHAPEIVVNTAAYHKVDIVEDDPDGAFAVNATGARNLAVACRELDAALVHISTDYVFSGRKREPYVESDAVDAINVYGVSKIAGEMLIRAVWPKHYIVRSSGLYGAAGSSGKGGNFVETMLRLASSGNEIRVVDDQVLTPTRTVPLASQIVELVGTGIYGTYHATCQGECSWYEFAAEIFRQSGLKPALGRQSTAESGAKATRPAYSVLENQALKRLELDAMPAWEQALADYLAARAASSTPQLA